MADQEKELFLIIDSGAFSAWKQEHEIDLDEYIDFLLSVQDWFTYAVNLDVIPGGFGRKPTPEEVEESARQGMENFWRMKEAGLNPIPVFHQGENFKWLDEMVRIANDSAHEMIVGISPANDRVVSDKKKWLDKVFTRLCEKHDGYPEVKTHGFAVTSIELMLRYPWFSVDSTTWKVVGGMGGVFVPQKTKAGGWDYTRTPFIVGMSHGKGAIDSGTQFDQLSKGAQQHVAEWIEGQGVTLKQARDSYHARWILNCRFMKRIEQYYEPGPFKLKNQGLMT